MNHWNVIEGPWNVYFISFSPLTKYYPLYFPPKTFKNINNILSSRAYKTCQQAGFEPSIAVCWPWSRAPDNQGSTNYPASSAGEIHYSSSLSVLFIKMGVTSSHRLQWGFREFLAHSKSSVILVMNGQGCLHGRCWVTINTSPYISGNLAWRGSS